VLINTEWESDLLSFCCLGAESMSRHAGLPKKPLRG